MATPTFDTHTAVKAMKASGLEEAVAGAIVAVIQMSRAHREDFLTKTDLDEGLKNFGERLVARLTARLGLMIFVAAVLAVVVTKLL